MVVLVGLDIFFGVPVPTSVPPQLPEYHVKVVPDPPAAVRLSVPPAFEQKLFASLDTEVGATGAAITLTVMLAQLELVHPVDSHLA